MKEIEFLGKSKKDLGKFPKNARIKALRQLDQVTKGYDPVDWKPMKIVGKGVQEIRIRDDSGIYRVIYVARLKNVVYVLHAFKKKTWETSQKDIDIAKRNYQEVAK